MEILGVNENIKGNLAVKGSIEGSYPDIIGKGTLKLENAIFGTFPLDDAEGEMQYGENEFYLKEFTAHTYNGVITGDALLSIPTGNYSVTADLADISSMKFYSYLGWDPLFPDGKLKGDFRLVHNDGKDIRIDANLSYRSISNPGDDVLSKLDNISATLKLENQSLILTDTILTTSDTRLSIDGNIDFKNKAIALSLQLTGQDAAELAAPYYKRFNAPVKFTGIATGSITDPEISGRLEFEAGNVHGIQFKSAFADLIYKIDSLSISNAWIKQGQSVIDLSGLINFRQARKVFSFDDPFFMINASINKFPVEQHISEIYKTLPVSGIVDSSIYFEGDTTKFTGNADISLSNSNFYGQEFDRISLETVIGPESISLSNIEAVKNESVFSGNGVIFFGKRFSMDISSPGIRLKDIDLIKNYPVNALIGMKVKGTGTFDNPDIQFSVDIHESTVKGINAGKGVLDGTLTGKNVTASGNLADGRILASLKADFPQFRSWSVDMNFKKERYDFLLSGFLKEIPDNFSLSAEGDLNFSSDNDKLIINSNFNYLNLSIYDYIFKNNGSVILNSNDDEITIKSLDFSGNNATLSASGEIKLNNSYDMTLKGDINISPLKALTEEFVFLDGRGNFDVDVKGSWDEPELIGKIDFKNVSAIFKSFPQGVGPLNGTFLLNRDKVTFDSVTTDFSGGSITLSGLGNFNRLSLEKLIVSSLFEGIRIRAVDGVSANINGSLFYETSTKGSNLTGEILIDKARYEKNIDLKKWFLGLSEIKKGGSQYSDFLKQTNLNIHVQGSKNILFNNDLAKAPVKIDLNIAGNVERYGLVGRVEADEGQIYFRGNELRILEGSSVDFVDPAQIYPLFHVLADTYKNDYYIKLSLDGTIDKFTLSFFSDPPLPEADILTLLTFGHTNKDIQGVEGGIAAQQASAMVAGGMQEDIQNEIKNIVGIERFEVEPHTTSSGAFTSKITVGKRLLEDQISVTYSTAIGTTDEQVIELEYKLNQELSLMGSRDEMGSAGADVKYRFEFK
jgi:translocation and assembly module TamB